MNSGAAIFMALAWTFVLGLMSWAFSKILRTQDHFDPDGIGPASPPVRGEAEERGDGAPPR